MRFLAIAIFLIIAFGLTLQAGIDVPWFLGWVGGLPGDLVIKKGDLTLYVPIVSSLLISAVLSFFLSVFSKK